MFHSTIKCEKCGKEIEAKCDNHGAPILPVGWGTILVVAIQEERLSGTKTFYIPTYSSDTLHVCDTCLDAFLNPKS